MYRHRTIASWQREEDGSYKADLDGFALHVRWRPESTDARRGFIWSAIAPDASTFEAEEVVEEAEQAMGEAEHAAKRHAHPEIV